MRILKKRALNKMIYVTFLLIFAELEADAREDREGSHSEVLHLNLQT
jgi:hypothetical protein